MTDPVLGSRHTKSVRRQTGAPASDSKCTELTCYVLAYATDLATVPFKNPTPLLSGGFFRGLNASSITGTYLGPYTLGDFAYTVQWCSAQGDERGVTEIPRLWFLVRGTCSIAEVEIWTSTNRWFMP